MNLALYVLATLAIAASLYSLAVGDPVPAFMSASFIFMAIIIRLCQIYTDKKA